MLCVGTLTQDALRPNNFTVGKLGDAEHGNEIKFYFFLINPESKAALMVFLIRLLVMPLVEVPLVNA